MATTASICPSVAAGTWLRTMGAKSPATSPLPFMSMYSWLNQMHFL